MHKEVNYKMAAISQFGSLHATLAMFLILVCFTFSSQVDSRLLDPTLIGRQLQNFAKEALGVDEMQVGIFKLCTSISSV